MARRRKGLPINGVLLLDKPARRVVDVDYDLAGFVIEDLFVLGYGTDLNQRYRELPFIGVRHASH